MITKLSIIGIGLIGGSLAKALKKTGFVKHIVGYDQNQTALTNAKALGIIDSYHLDIASAINDCDMCVVATPVNDFKTIFRQIKPHLNSRLIITDVGSTKGSVISAAKAVFNEVPALFVPAHPIAGGEKSGVSASDVTLFQGKRIILTPLKNTDKKAIETVTAMWQASGATCQQMSAKEHDTCLALTSHLPHVLAYTLMTVLLDARDDVFDYTAGGFKDFSRIASSDPIMWRDVCLNNVDDLLAQITHFQNALTQISDSIKKQDGKTLEAIFKRAQKARNDYLKKQ